MSKKQKIDFLLKETEYEELIFRFRPRRSSCHSFNDKPPKSWKEVYKVYYAYSIIRRSKDDNYVETVFDCHCDECSIIDEVGMRAKHISEGKRVVEISCKDETYVVKLLNQEVHPIGYGVSWSINRCHDKNKFEVVLWGWDNQGFRFYLDKEKLGKFGDYLLECCEYMLAHGCPI